jgi:hypothetical protein
MYDLGIVEDSMRSVIAAKLATGFELLHRAATKDVASHQSEHQSNEPWGLNMILEQQLSRKPFDILAEGLISEKNRGERTAIELFLAGIRGWEAGMKRRMDDDKSKPS